MKLAFVIQRYGTEVAGGAEAHCRGLVTALRPTHDVEVLTTCALDYVTWKNHYPAGTTRVDEVTVTRYPNERERDVARFAAISDLVFNEDHTRNDERRWIEENGPVSPGLIAAIGQRRDVDFFILYSYRYYSAALGAKAAAGRAVLVPTAEDDPAMRLGIFADVFRSARGLLYLTPEEQQLVEHHTRVSASSTPSAIIGSGVSVPSRIDPDATRKFELQSSNFEVPYVFYAGRIDRNKGVDTLCRYYAWLCETWPDAPTLVLAGHQVIDIPLHPKIRYVGYVSDAEKAALIAGAAVAIMPSAFESLSLFALESWALGTPVLANARCKVLEGQCRRSNAGLYYRDLAEFAAMLKLLMSDPELRRGLGDSGRSYVAAEYSWSIAAGRVASLLANL
jgi:glycosyltransferase involved in cell wall biosynthesis